MLEAPRHEYLNERHIEIVYRAEMTLSGVVAYAWNYRPHCRVNWISGKIGNRRALAIILEKFLVDDCGHGQGRLTL